MFFRYCIIHLMTTKETPSILSPDTLPDLKQFLYTALTIQNLEVYGGSLFLAEPIKAGEEIFSFHGLFVSQEDATDLALQIGKNVYLETDPTADYENYLNHACYTATHKPNCGIHFQFVRPVDEKLLGQHSRPGEI